MSEKYLGENSTPLLINQIKENCTQKRSTLPIASIDELGNTYQYMGTTSGSLVHGYFYECMSDGQDPATYFWSQVNTQPTAGTPTAATTTFDNTTSELSATNVQEAIDEVDGRIDTAESDINSIEEKIPSTASDTNLLVDHDSLGTAAFKDFTTNVSPNNHSLVESNAVYSAINNAVSSVYTPRGNIACADLTSGLLIASNVGNVYNTTDSGTTTALFMQGAGISIPQNSTVGIIQTSPNTYLFNLMGNTIDLHDYQKQDLTTPLTIGGTSETTVEDALDGLNNLIPSNADQTTNKLSTASDLTNEVTTRGKNGKHNFLPFYMDVIRSLNTSGSWDATGTRMYTINGGTITMLEGGYFTVNGTFTADCQFNGLSRGSGYCVVPNDTYHLSGAVSGISISLIRKISNIGEIIAVDTGNGKNFTLNGDDYSAYQVDLGYRLDITAGTYNNVSIKPMITLATDKYTTYSRYSEDNVTLTDKVNKDYGAGVNVIKLKGDAQTLNGLKFVENPLDGSVRITGTITAGTGAGYNLYYIANDGYSECPIKANTYYKVIDTQIGTGTKPCYVEFGESNNIVAHGAKGGYGSGQIGCLSTLDSCIIRLSIRDAAIGDVFDLTVYPMLIEVPQENNGLMPYIPKNQDVVSYDVNTYLGAKNLLKLNYTQLKAWNPNGTWNSPTSFTRGGVTFTIDYDEGTITANGTAGESAFIIINSIKAGTGLIDSVLYNINKAVIVSGTPYGKGSIGQVRVNNANATTGNAVDANGLGTQPIMFKNDVPDSYYVLIYCQVNNGQVANNLVFKPMVRIAEDTDSTFQPFSMTNRQLTPINISHNFATAKSGYTILDPTVFKIGNLIMGTCVIQKDSGYINQALTEVITFKYKSICSVNSYCAMSSSRYNGSILELGYLWITENTTSLQIANVPNVNASFAKVNFCYMTDAY